MKAPPASLVDRFLDVASGGSPELLRAQLRAFRRFVLFYGAARTWLWATLVPGSHPELVVCALVQSVCAAMAWSKQWETLAPRLALAPLLFELVWRVGISSNHLFIEVLSVLLLCVADARSRSDEALCMQGLRWMTAIVLFHTGLQKILYGLYFHGDFLGLMVATQERFARVFALLLPAGELERLRALDPWTTGAGPFRPDAGLFVAASNAVYLAELCLPLLLLARPTRTFGAIATVALLVAIQLGALELGFAFLFLNLVFLFLGQNWNQRLLPIFAAFLAYALLAAVGWLPGDPLYWNLM